MKVAASAYENVLKSLDGAADDPSAREYVARYIMERMLAGERDPVSISGGALAYVEQRAKLVLV
jgi:hypothetical protein